MIVSNNTLLNILLPNDNKVLKEVLKEADSKSLEQMMKNNSTSINDVFYLFQVIQSKYLFFKKEIMILSTSFYTYTSNRISSKAKTNLIYIL